jgi:hypothetical protein
MKNVNEHLKEKSTNRPFNKPDSFLKIYDSLFSNYVNTDVSLLEVGVQLGGSLQLWKDHLGNKASIYGIDIHPSEIQELQIKEFIADQGDRESLKRAIALIPKIDICIDDGSHISQHQINTFEEVFPFISENGLYICEDIFTSYREKFGGGYKNPNSFIEYCKDLIDSFYPREDERIKTNIITKKIASISFYLGLVVIRKI